MEPWVHCPSTRIFKLKIQLVQVPERDTAAETLLQFKPMKCDLCSEDYEFMMYSQKGPLAGRLAPPLLCRLLAHYLWSQTGSQRNYPVWSKVENYFFYYEMKIDPTFTHPSFHRFLTLLRISVLRRSLISMLKASSFNCGPRLQEIVIHALPGRSQSF